MFNKKTGFNWRIIGFLIFLIHLWLFCLAIIDYLFYDSDHTKRSDSFFSLLIISVIVYVVLLALIPIQILYFERKNRDKASLKKAKFIDYVSLFFVTTDTDVEAPKWLSIPLLTILWLLIGIIALFVVLAIVSFCLAKVMS